MSQIIRIAIFCLIFIMMSARTFAQEFEWAKKAGGTGTDQGNNLYVDQAGNSYVVGGFSVLASFGSTTLNTMPRVNIHRSDDVFLAKYDPQGNLTWAKKMSTTHLDYGNDIAVDASGNIYVTGCFSGSASFGPVILQSNGYMDVFLVKYTGNGNLIWAKQAGGGFHDIGHSIGLDAVGNCYITGFFHSPAIFGKFRLNDAGSPAFFIAKYDVDGNEVWAKSASGSHGVIGFEMAVDPQGNCYVTGSVYGNANFPPFQLEAGPQHETFIVKYDANGNIPWAKILSNKPWQNYSCDIKLDHAGNFYLTGVFTGNLNLDNTPLKSLGSYDAFISKYDPGGHVIWAKSIGGSNAEDYLAIATNTKGDLFVAGNFQGTATFGNSTFTSSGESDLYIIRLDTQGEAMYSMKAGGPAKDFSYNIALDSAGHAYITGYFSGKAAFGITALESSGETDVFIAKIGKATGAPPTIATATFDGSAYCAGSTFSVSFNAQGRFYADNTFEAQLSDASGSFVSPTIIGSGPSNPLQVTIPVNTPAGSGYKIRIIGSAPAVTSNENNDKIIIKASASVSGLPNIITPNGDGLNETFNIAPNCFPIRLTVYNRWGKQVYEKEDYHNSWNGDKLNAGIYYYKVTNEAGEIWKGWVEITR